MEEESKTRGQARGDRVDIRAALKAYRESAADQCPSGTTMGDMFVIMDLIDEGKFDVARDQTIELAERNPREFALQRFACTTFQHLGLESEAYKTLMVMIALHPGSVSDTYRDIAGYLRKSGAPNRAHVMLDMGWEHKKKTVRRRDLETAKKEYYGDQHDGTAPLNN